MTRAEAHHQVVLADLVKEHEESRTALTAAHASAMRLLQSENDTELQLAKARFKEATASQVDRAQQLERHYKALTAEQEASAVRADELHQQVAA